MHLDITHANVHLKRNIMFLSIDKKLQNKVQMLYDVTEVVWRQTEDTKIPLFYPDCLFYREQADRSPFDHKQPFTIGPANP